MNVFIEYFGNLFGGCSCSRKCTHTDKHFVRSMYIVNTVLLRVTHLCCMLFVNVGYLYTLRNVRWARAATHILTN